MAHNIYAQSDLIISKLAAPIIVDGMIDPAWKKADSISGFYQLEPSKGESSTKNTIVKAAQYQQNIYFLFINRVENRSEITSRIQRRDQLNDSDDIVSIMLDTYLDNRTSLLFQVNPLGTLTDAKISDDGKKVDFLWDTEWEARTSIGVKYWVAEVRIPLKSIQYNPTSSAWGVNFGRVIRLNQETTWWTNVSESYRVSQGGKLQGIDPNSNKHTLRLFPYGRTRYENSDITGEYDKTGAAVGGDIQYQYSSNVISNITINPDFATVEGDQEQINLTPWELRFPDKRLFFQDGNEMFGTRIQTFYSRRIGDMKYGGKMIGKTGKYQFNALLAATKSDIENSIPEARFNTFRLKRDILNSSTVGLTYADKVIDTATVRSVSMDYVLNLGKTWKLTGQFVGSTPGDLMSHSAWFVRFARENNIYHYHIRYSNIGKNFQKNVNETGFIPDDDRHELDSDIKYRFWVNNKIKYLSFLSKNNVFWSQSGVVRSWFLTQSARAYLSNRLSFDLAINDEFKLLDKEYDNHYVRGILGYNTDEASSVSLSYRDGVNFDRDFRLWEFESRFQLFKKLTVTYQLKRLSYSPDPGINSTTINVAGLDYFFTKDLWVRAFIQGNSRNDRFYFYGLFGWRFKPPFGAFYLILNNDNFYNFDREMNMNSEIVFLKLTYPLTIL
ncbi:MAG: carbohydrate binding family 9 domain-containing protein [Cyclobacteriaceae bacterium]